MFGFKKLQSIRNGKRKQHTQMRQESIITRPTYYTKVETDRESKIPMINMLKTLIENVKKK